MAVSTKDIRNVVFLSHSGEGKTTLVESLLFKGGAISKKGSVEDGTTVSDYNDDEKERKNSINLSVSFYEKDGIKANLLDAPGYLDYIGDIIAGIDMLARIAVAKLPESSTTFSPVRISAATARNGIPRSSKSSRRRRCSRPS